MIVRTVEVPYETRSVQTERAIFGEAVTCSCTEFEKLPTEVLDYQILWGRWLASDKIVASTWAADSTDVTIASNAFNPYTTTVWLSGGISGATYRLTNTITTVNGRTAVVSFELKIDDCGCC